MQEDPKLDFDMVENKVLFAEDYEPLHKWGAALECQ